MQLARQNRQLFYEAYLHLATRGEPAALALHQRPHFLSAECLAIAHAVGDGSRCPPGASSLVFRPSRSCELPNMSLRAAKLALDKLRLNICRFLQTGSQAELSREFKAGLQALLPEREHCFESSATGVGAVGVDLRAASKNKSNARSAWSIVFSASSRSSAGTSNLGSVIIVPPVR